MQGSGKDLQDDDALGCESLAAALFRVYFRVQFRVSFGLQPIALPHRERESARARARARARET